MVTHITVSGKEFFASRWREAILYFCFRTWENDAAFLNDPVISFDSVSLRLCWEGRERYNHIYRAYGGELDGSIEPPSVQPEKKIVVEWTQAGNVRDGLMCFAKNNTIKRIDIRLESYGGGRRLILVKGNRRGELFVYGHIISFAETIDLPEGL